MREILFRGQTRRKGEKVRMDRTPVESNWVYGGVFQGPNHSVIYGYDPIEKHVVYSDTVGQYTGLQDKNGTKIFEGDILNLWVDDDNEYDPIKKYRAVVEFGNPNAEYNWGFQLKMIDRMSFNEDILLWVEMEDTGAFCEVIGNIHDNPELVRQV